MRAQAGYVATDGLPVDGFSVIRDVSRSVTGPAGPATVRGFVPTGSVAGVEVGMVGDGMVGDGMVIWEEVAVIIAADGLSSKAGVSVGIDVAGLVIVATEGMVSTVEVSAVVTASCITSVLRGCDEVVRDRIASEAWLTVGIAMLEMMDGAGRVDVTVEWISSAFTVLACVAIEFMTETVEFEVGLSADRTSLEAGDGVCAVMGDETSSGAVINIGMAEDVMVDGAGKVSRMTVDRM